MLGEALVSAVVAVKDMSNVTDFYEGKLGLKPDKKDPGGGILYKCAEGTAILVYPTQMAGGNKATAAAWKVDDAAKTVEELKSKGVTFEHYDLPGATREGDVHVMGELKAAWFKDPEGNILNVVSGM